MLPSPEQHSDGDSGDICLGGMSINQDRIELLYCNDSGETTPLEFCTPESMASLLRSILPFQRKCKGFISQDTALLELVYE